MKIFHGIAFPRLSPDTSKTISTVISSSGFEPPATVRSPAFTVIVGGGGGPAAGGGALPRGVAPPAVLACSATFQPQVRS